MLADSFRFRVGDPSPYATASPSYSSTCRPFIGWQGLALFLHLKSKGALRASTWPLDIDLTYTHAFFLYFQKYNAMVRIINEAIKFLPWQECARSHFGCREVWWKTHHICSTCGSSSSPLSGGMARTWSGFHRAFLPRKQARSAASASVKHQVSKKVTIYFLLLLEV